MEPILPPPTPSHTWAELLRLVGAVRRLAFLAACFLAVGEWWA